MRLFFAIVLGITFFSGRGLAQDNNVSTAGLQSVLSNLKQSVEKLSLTNDQLAARDKAMQTQVLQLQTQLGRLQAQGDLLNKTADKLRGKDPRRARQIVRLEKENFDLDNHIQKAERRIKLIQQSSQTPSPESQTGERRQKEKLKLMKMIYDSQQRQESLHEAILEFLKK